MKKKSDSFFPSTINKKVKEGLEKSLEREKLHKKLTNKK